MKKSMVLCAALVLVLGAMEASAKKLPVTPTGRTMDSLNVTEYANEEGSREVLWKSFDIGKGDTFTFRSNDAEGVINIVRGKKASTLEGTLRSYMDVYETRNVEDPDNPGSYIPMQIKTGEDIGGRVVIINDNGINVKKGFVFEGCTLELNVVDAGAGVYMGTLAPEDKEFTISKGALNINKKGAITGNASFALADGAGFGAGTANKQNASFGDLKVGENGWLDIDSAKDLKVGNLTLDNYAQATLDADKNTKVNDVTMNDSARFFAYADNNLTVRGILADDETVVELWTDNDVTISRNVVMGDDASFDIGGEDWVGRNIKMGNLSMDSGEAYLGAIRNITVGDIVVDGELGIGNEYGKVKVRSMNLTSVELDVYQFELSKASNIETANVVDIPSKLKIAKGVNVEDLEMEGENYGSITTTKTVTEKTVRDFLYDYRD